MSGHTLFDHAALQSFRFAEPDDAGPRESYIYIVAISTGLTKIGYSSKVGNRVATYFANATIYGASIDGAWVSMPHANARDNETVLLAQCRKVAEPGFGSEYFRGLPFANAVALAESLTFEREPRIQQVEPSPRPRRGVFSLEEVAEQIGVDAGALKRDCQARRIRHVRLGRRTWGMVPDQIEALVAELNDDLAPVRRRREGKGRLSTRLLHAPSSALTP